MKFPFIKSVYAHCDLPCGVYDPVQAEVEAKSVYAIMTKYDSLSQEDKWRAVTIKDQRADLVKHHLWVLWSDYFKPEHLEKYPDLHEKFWHATKQASACKHTTDIAEAKKLLDMIHDISVIFAETKKA